MAETGLTNENWPIAAAMIQYGNTLPDGSSVQDQHAEGWAETLGDVVGVGFTELDPTDCWLRVADLSSARLEEFKTVCQQVGLTTPAISTSRKSIIGADADTFGMAYHHRLIDAATAIGAKHVNFGFFGPLTAAQQTVPWFWTQPGVVIPDDPAVYRRAVEGIRELAGHAETNGLDVSMELYEDTYVGTADKAVKFVQDVDHPAVGINPDMGNLVRLHRPMESWRSMMEKMAPYVKYWHCKNYLRIEDQERELYLSAPAPLETGIISYRVAIRMAIAQGFRGALCLEHYGGDGLSVCGTNRAYLRKILPKHVGPV